MKNNNRGIVAETLLVYVLLGVVAFFVPNPVSSAVGIGIRPNKTVQRDSIVERVEFIKDKDGNPIATKTTTTRAASDLDQQQKVSIWEQLRSLPILWLILMGLGGFFPVVAGVMAKINRSVKNKLESIADNRDVLNEEAKKIVRGLDKAIATIPETLAGEKLAGEVDRAALAKKITDKFLIHRVI